MTKGFIRYRKGYKYVVDEDYEKSTSIVGYDIENDYLKLSFNGTLLIKKGYASDGPSGPTYDDDTNIRGAIGHDALYQLMRLGLLPQSVRCLADKDFRKELLEDGMNGFRAWYYYQGVDHFAAYAAKYGTERKSQAAPKKKTEKHIIHIIL